MSEVIEEKKTVNTGKRAVYYEKAKELYVVFGFSIDMIAGLFEDKVTSRTLRNWRMEFDWDGKRREHLDSNKGLLEETRELVRLTLNKAKAEPSSQNISAYSKAVEALRKLEAVNLMATPEEDKPEAAELTPESAEEIRKKVLGL